MADNHLHSKTKFVHLSRDQQPNRSNGGSMLGTLQSSYRELSWIQFELASAAGKHEIPERVDQLLKEIQKTAESLLTTMEACEAVLSESLPRAAHKPAHDQVQLAQRPHLPMHLRKELSRFEAEMNP